MWLVLPGVLQAIRQQMNQWPSGAASDEVRFNECIVPGNVKVDSKLVEFEYFLKKLNSKSQASNYK